MRKSIFLSGILLFFSFWVHSQQVKPLKGPGKSIDRKAIVAGQFYPAEEEELLSMLKRLFEEAKQAVYTEMPCVLVVPHAGYIYSGKVAASAYNQMSNQAEIDNVFILAASHHTQFSGASVYSGGDYHTPLGRVNVNQTLAKKLINSNPLFRFKEEAHQKEHSIEVQLPFLQYRLGSSFQIIPIVIGTHDPASCSLIGEALKPYFGRNNLFIVSTDFSHYPDYDSAKDIDRATADMVVSNRADNLLQMLRANTQRDVPNFLTSMCGWPAMVSLLHITEYDKNIFVKKIHYENSGDGPGNKSRVVGYWAIAFYNKKTEDKTMSFQLNDKEKELLLEIARTTLEGFVREGKIPKVDAGKLTEALQTHAGAFVSLHKDGELRGCIGRFSPNQSLYKVVQEITIASATQDMRFAEVHEEELDEIEIEISVLTPMERIYSIDDIKLGEHGVYIKKGNHSGTFLPQVAQHTNWTLEEFLGHCTRDKAGLHWDDWKSEDAEIYTYSAIVFKEQVKK